MTRTIRTRYESDDASEADIVSDRDGVRLSYKESGENLRTTATPEDRHDDDGYGYPTLSQQARQRVPMAEFYSVRNLQGVSPEEPQHLDFEPPAVAKSQTSSRIVSVTSQGQSLGIDEVTRHLMQSNSKREEYRSIPPHSETSSSPMVVTHHLMPWDDQHPYDLPYHNPFYTKSFEEFLWLPRNPGGLLDLDDTIKLKVAITVEETAGRLGAWLGIEDRFTHDEMAVHSEPSLEPKSPFVGKSLCPPRSLDEDALSHHNVFDSFQDISNGDDEIDAMPILLRREATLREPVFLPNLSETRDTLAVTSKALETSSQHMARLPDRKVGIDTQTSALTNSVATEPFPELPSAGLSTIPNRADVDCGIFLHSNAFKTFQQVLKDDGETRTSNPMLTRHLSMLDLPVATIQRAKRSISTPDIVLKSPSFRNARLSERGVVFETQELV